LVSGDGCLAAMGRDEAMMVSLCLLTARKDGLIREANVQESSRKW